MEEAAKRRLEAAGIDVDDALGRFLQNEALMMKFLGRFPADTSFSRLQEAMAHGDAAQAFEAAHTLKGVAGNLSLKRLYEALTPMVEELRAGDLAAAAARMDEAELWYSRVVEAIAGLS